MLGWGSSQGAKHDRVLGVALLCGHPENRLLCAQSQTRRTAPRDPWFSALAAGWDCLRGVNRTDSRGPAQATEI